MRPPEEGPAAVASLGAIVSIGLLADFAADWALDQGGRRGGGDGDGDGSRIGGEALPRWRRGTLEGCRRSHSKEAKKKKCLSTVLGEMEGIDFVLFRVLTEKSSRLQSTVVGGGSLLVNWMMR